MTLNVKDVSYETPTTRGLVHCDIRCETCDFIADDYQTAMKDAAKHYAKTGHNLQGDACYFVKIGSKARQELDARLAQIMGQNPMN